jgi:uncharacterized membrane-anchored protein
MSGVRVGRAIHAFPSEIVEQRLQTIGERKVGGLPTWSLFFARRMKPALPTSVTTEARQASLSSKLARAANLLRTGVDVELEQQNQEPLKSMNARTRLQLRLQATVEGLSVAAITYYVSACSDISQRRRMTTADFIWSPAWRPLRSSPSPGSPSGWTVRRIRKKHIAGEN